MKNANLDLKNISAFMVHHVLNSSKHIANKKKTTLKKKNNGKLKGHVSFPCYDKSKLYHHGPHSKKKSQHKAPEKKSNQSNKTCSPLSTKKMQNEIENHGCISQTSFMTSFENKSLFQWMLRSVEVHHFLKNYWEKKPLHITNKSNDFSVLLNTPLIDSILSTGNIQYTKNIDITLYRDNVKELHNIEGTARPHVVWDYYCDGCSVRLLNPQAFVPNIHKLASELQEFFGCFVGCNSYLTPPNSQGFAPHYDDIEAFILQIEGKKRWRVYEPRSQFEILPRYSSTDFRNDDLPDPIMEVVLDAGNVLYLPRGYIHQAVTVNDTHSLHVTISMFQCNAWIDLLTKVIPSAVEKAWKSDVEYRKGLPLDYLLAAGMSKDKKHKSTRRVMESKLKSLISNLSNYIQLDLSVDQMARGFMEDALPPVLTEEEKRCTVYGGGLRMENNGQVIGSAEFEFSENTQIAILRQFACRLVKEIVERSGSRKKKVQYRLYYTTDNSLEYHAVPPSFLIIEKKSVPCIQYLFQSFPKYASIAELPHDNLENKITLVSELWERGIIRTRNPIIEQVL